MTNDKDLTQAIQLKLDEIKNLLGGLPEWKRENINKWLSLIEDTINKPQREDLPNGHLIGPKGQRII